MKKKELRLTDYELISLTNQANRKVEKLFPDLCTFHLPQVLRKNKEYTLKLLYDVFIEFKTFFRKFAFFCHRFREAAYNITDGARVAETNGRVDPKRDPEFH